MVARLETLIVGRWLTASRQSKAAQLCFNFSSTTGTWEMEAFYRLRVSSWEQTLSGFLFLQFEKTRMTLKERIRGQKYGVQEQISILTRGLWLISRAVRRLQEQARWVSDSELSHPPMQSQTHQRKFTIHRYRNLHVRPSEVNTVWAINRWSQTWTFGGECRLTAVATSSLNTLGIESGSYKVRLMARFCAHFSRKL